MPTITRIPVAQLDESHTLYIDGKSGIITEIGWDDSAEEYVIAYEDAHGEHVGRFHPDDSVPTLRSTR